MRRPAWFGSEPDIIIATRKNIARAKRRRETVAMTQETNDVVTQELIERLEPCPYVLGRVRNSGDYFSEDDGPLWEAEVQTNGGYGVAATIYADTEDAARQMAEQAITAWNTRDQSQSARIAELEPKAVSYDHAHEDAVEMGYPSLTEALEHLDELRSHLAKGETHD